jgi:hypothetical protein
LKKIKGRELEKFFQMERGVKIKFANFWVNEEITGKFFTLLKLFPNFFSLIKRI